MTTLELLRRAWSLDPYILAIVAIGIGGYAWSVRGRPGARASWFGVATLAFLLAMSSPVGVLARGYLFSAHMLQHLVLVLAVPPLVLLALPAQARGLNGAHDTVETACASPKSAISPWLLGVGAMWLWHAPTLCDAAGRLLAVQRIQTVSLLGMGAAFWWPICGPNLSRRLAPLASIVYLFGACIACTVLGVLVTFSPLEVCSIYAHPVDTLGVLPLLRDGWGITPKADQEIGGLLMWVPACFVYTFAILMMLARYYADEARPGHAENGIQEEAT